MKSKQINISIDDVTTQNENRHSNENDNKRTNKIMGDLVMKNSLNYSNRIIRKSIFLVAFIIFTNIMVVSANDSKIKIDSYSEVVEVEEELQLEPWMLNVNLFENMMDKSMDLTFSNEEKIPVEPWMLNPFLFQKKIHGHYKFNNERFVLHEMELELENWMLDSDDFLAFVNK